MASTHACGALSALAARRSAAKTSSDGSPLRAGSVRHTRCQVGKLRTTKAMSATHWTWSTGYRVHARSDKPEDRTAWHGARNGGSFVRMSDRAVVKSQQVGLIELARETVLATQWLIAICLGFLVVQDSLTVRVRRRDTGPPPESTDYSAAMSCRSTRALSIATSWRSASICVWRVVMLFVCLAARSGVWMLAAVDRPMAPAGAVNRTVAITTKEADKTERRGETCMMTISEDVGNGNLPSEEQGLLPWAWL